MSELNLPLTEEQIRALHAGDHVLINGVIVTARDTAHKYMIENFVEQKPPPDSEKELGQILENLLKGGMIYHCGPVVAKEGDAYRFVAAGPTTSTREEPYQAAVIDRFQVRAVIGKGGMGPKTLAGLQKTGAVYLHAIGGAATLIAKTVEKVEAVYKLSEFGTPEAFWQIRVKNFPAVVTMDSHGQSLHHAVLENSTAKLKELIG